MANPMTQTLASTGTAELHHEPAAFGITAPGFVAISMLVVVLIILWAKVPAMIGKMLDARIAAIRSQLDEAAKLRAEAEALLVEAKKRTASSQSDAAAIIAAAESEAAEMLASAKTHAADMVKRRKKMAEDKIAAAEREAIAEIRGKVATVATKAASVLLAQNHGAGADQALVNQTIAGLSRPN